MLLSFVIPELIFGVAMFFVFTSLFSGVGLGTLAETLALVTWNVSWPAVIVQARLATIGNSYSEAAADLGCNPFQTMRRVMLPLLSPAIFASAILVFSTVIDDFVIVDLLSNCGVQHPDVGVHLRHPARRQRRPGAERARHDHADHVVRHRDPRLLRLPADDQRRARHLRPTRWPPSPAADRRGHAGQFAARRPALPSRAQVVIVGGGVIGCSIAYHLAHLGWTDVVLLEQHQLTAGTTWHAAGLITSAGMTDETALFFSRYSRDLYARLEAETGHSTGFRAGRALVAGHARRSGRRHCAARRPGCTASASRTRRSQPRELAELWPLAKTDDVLSAFYVADEGRADPGRRRHLARQGRAPARRRAWSRA